MTSELARRIAFTLGALLVYRLGAQIPLPGLGVSGIADQGNTWVASAVARLSLFSLSLTPYVTAAFLLQFVALVSRRQSVLDQERAAPPDRRTADPAPGRCDCGDSVLRDRAGTRRRAGSRDCA